MPTVQQHDIAYNLLYQTSGDTWSEAPSIKIRCCPRRYGRGAGSGLFDKVFIALDAMLSTFLAVFPY
ncbi:hypothetical protein QE177_09845 [Arsenophonus sp. aPb]|uniref:hypothetical protein n=1 Tax=Arsenophonus sp. aPb TaxID=3041619 RepID=UPI002468A0A1|nr:hypothetical protein [Arsenophonus sp. aPb]WGL97510.1 hypothetical protein QE177_09845 [Arsenophonus sp. aPb]